MESAVILLLSLVIDLILGEYPSFIHPVVWLGKVISLELRVIPGRVKRVQIIYGSVIVISTVALFALPVYFLLSYLKGVSPAAYILIAAFLFKSTFSVKKLQKVALRVEELLERGDLKKARTKMSSLVSRDVDRLNEPLLVSATVESVAENIGDSFIAPFFYFIFFGVPGAIAYRVVNTFDARIGYHGKYEYLGKFSARMDDVLNFIPARISGILLVIATYLCKKDGRGAWAIMFRDHKRTDSPNAGWPMSAVAGALGVQLEKVGCYKLGNANNSLSPRLIISEVNIARVSILLWVLLCLIIKWIQIL